MKNKITRFLLMIAFAIAAVCCKVDAGKIPLSDNCTICYLSHTYTEQEQQQIRQNLIGTYRGLDVRNVQITFSLSQDNVLNFENIPWQNINLFSLIRNRFPAHPSYDTANFHYRLVFHPGSFTQIIGIRAVSADNYVVEYFEKLETDDNSEGSEEYDHPVHDEFLVKRIAKICTDI